MHLEFLETVTSSLFFFSWYEDHTMLYIIYIYFLISYWGEQHVPKRVQPKGMRFKLVPHFLLLVLWVWCIKCPKIGQKASKRSQKGRGSKFVLPGLMMMMMAMMPMTSTKTTMTDGTTKTNMTKTKTKTASKTNRQRKPKQRQYFFI